jgi:hypothetical protein
MAAWLMTKSIVGPGITSITVAARRKGIHSSKLIIHSSIRAKSLGQLPHFDVDVEHSKANTTYKENQGN